MPLPTTAVSRRGLWLDIHVSTEPAPSPLSEAWRAGEGTTALEPITSPGLLVPRA